MSNRKITVILLIILALAIGGGAWWFFRSSLISNETDDAGRQAEIQQLEAIKELAVYNVQDFLVTKEDPDSIWQDLLANKQFASLEENRIEISLDQIGNPQPFDPLGVVAESGSQ